MATVWASLDDWSCTLPHLNKREHVYSIVHCHSDRRRTQDFIGWSCTLSSWTLCNWINFEAIGIDDVYYNLYSLLGQIWPYWYCAVGSEEDAHQDIMFAFDNTCLTHLLNWKVSLPALFCIYSSYYLMYVIHRPKLICGEGRLRQFMKERLPGIRTTYYYPTYWAPGGHFQTILRAIFQRLPPIRYIR